MAHPFLEMLGWFSCAASVSVLLALSVLVSPLKALIAASLRLMVGWSPSCRTSQLGHTKYGVWSHFPRFSFACGCLWSVRSCLCFAAPSPAFFLAFCLGSSLLLAPPSLLLFWTPSAPLVALLGVFSTFFAFFSCFLWKNTTSPHHTFSAPTHSIFTHFPRNFYTISLTYDLWWASKDFLISCPQSSHLGPVPQKVRFFSRLFLSLCTLEGVSEVINNFCSPVRLG